MRGVQEGRLALTGQEKIRNIAKRAFPKTNIFAVTVGVENKQPVTMERNKTAKEKNGRGRGVR